MTIINGTDKEIKDAVVWCKRVFVCALIRAAVDMESENKNMLLLERGKFLGFSSNPRLSNPRPHRFEQSWEIMVNVENIG